MNELLTKADGQFISQQVMLNRSSIGALKASIGDMSSLSTSAKTTIVEAINEIANKGVIIDPDLDPNSHNAVENSAITAGIDAVMQNTLANRSSIQALDVSVKAIQSSMTTVEDAIAKNTTSIGKLDIRVKSLEDEMPDFRDAIARNSTSIARLQTSVAGNKTSIALLDARIGSLSDLKTSAKTTIVTAINELYDEFAGGVDIVFVSTLPAVGKEKTVYFVPAQQTSTNDLFDEWVWHDNAWERVGSATIDLSDYATKDYVTNSIAALKVDVDANTSSIAKLAVDIDAVADEVFDARTSIAKLNVAVDANTTSIGKIDLQIIDLASQMADARNSISKLDTNIGNMSSLSTSAKTTIVEAINEVYRRTSSGTCMEYELDGSLNADTLELTLRCGSSIQKLDVTGFPVNVELTQAEYDALSDAEKNNGTVYFITDGAGGGGKAYTAGAGIDITGDVISVKDEYVKWNVARTDASKASLTSYKKYSGDDTQGLFQVSTRGNSGENKVGDMDINVWVQAGTNKISKLDFFYCDADGAAMRVANSIIIEDTGWQNGNGIRYRKKNGLLFVAYGDYTPSENIPAGVSHTMDTLPQEYRPSTRVLGVIMAGSEYANAFVETNGDVKIGPRTAVAAGASMPLRGQLITIM